MKESTSQIRAMVLHNGETTLADFFAYQIDERELRPVSLFVGVAGLKCVYPDMSRKVP